MELTMILILILLPLLGALLLRITPGDGAQRFLTRAFSILVVIFSVVVGVILLVSMGDKPLNFNLTGPAWEWINYVMLGVEWLIALYIIVTGLRNRKRLVAFFAALGVCAMTWFEFSGFAHGSGATFENTLYVDKLTVIMILIIGVIGGLICLYSAGYMKDYHHHHTEYKKRTSMFFSTLFLFLSAMFGLVLCNNLIWLLCFWEITTFASFLLIGYTKTPEATNNAFRAAVINVGGGVAFAAALIFSGIQFHVLDMQGMMEIFKSGGVDQLLLAVPVFLLCFAGITKSAQMPFASWLLGAMVAPTPTSALLHSSTMVKAGVYIIIRMSPMMGDGVGTFIALIGAFTFLATAILAISQSDAKRVLAYSTISNLGLIILCAGLHTAEAIWAAVMIVIFHAVAKSLLFLTVGSTEHCVGSRDLEELDTGIRISRPIGLCLMIGIAGMFLAPFGMLISKWAAMKAVVEANNLLLLVIIAFGSAVTLFFWTKWMGKVVANYPRESDPKYKQPGDVGISLFIHAILTVACCVFFWLISNTMVNPFISSMGMQVTEPINHVSTVLLVAMVCLLFLVPLMLLPKKNKHKQSSIYLAGENVPGEDLSFRGGLGAVQKAQMRNWYMSKFFGEKVLFGKATLVAALIILLGAGFVGYILVEVMRNVV